MGVAETQQHLWSTASLAAIYVPLRFVAQAAQRKVFDIVNYLGLSTTIMNVVERREVVDKYIVYGGMVGITTLLFLIWWYV